MYPKTMPDTQGMCCPTCGGTASYVKDTRPAPGNSVRRRRLCHHCKNRWTTYEMNEEDYHRHHRLGLLRDRLKTLLHDVTILQGESF